MNMEQNHITTNIVKNLITLRGHLEIRDYDVVLLLIVLKKFHLIDSNIDGAFYNVYNIVREKINSRVVALEKSANFDMIDKIVALEKVISHYDSTLNQMKPQQLEEILYVLDSISDEEKNYTEVFTEFLHTWQKGLGRSEDQILQPKELTSFINELVGDKSQLDIYNPFAGAASFALDSNYRSYHGQEIKMRTWAIGMLNLIINDAFSNSEYECKDSINYWPSSDQKFDLIVANPPLIKRLESNLVQNLILPVRTAEQFVLLKGLENLRADGKMILLTRTSFLSSGGIDKQIREHLVNENLIDTIIQLPSGILYNTGIATCLIVLNKNKSDDNIRFIDGSSYKVNQLKVGIFNYQQLLADLSDDNTANLIERIIESASVVANEFNLNVPQYFIEPAGMDEILLEDLLINVDQASQDSREIDRPFIRIKDLSNDILTQELDLRMLERTTASKFNYRVVSEDAILVSLVHTIKVIKFKFTGEEVYLDKNIHAFKYNKNLVDDNYLFAALLSEQVMAQFEKLTKGSIVARTSIKDFLKIKIQRRTLEDQKAYYNDILRNIVSSKLHLKEFIVKDHLQTVNDENSLLKHQIAGALSNVQFAVAAISKIIKNQIMEQLPNVLELKYDNRLPSNLGSYLSIIEKDMMRISSSLEANQKMIELEKMTLQEFYLTPTLREYLDNKKAVVKDYDFDFHFDLTMMSREVWEVMLGDQFDPETFSDKILMVNGDKMHLENVLDNLINNAVKHAFIDDLNPKKIEINISHLTESTSVLISVKNTGKPLPANITIQDLVRKGSSFGENGNTGIGLWYVNEIIKAHNGNFSFEDYTKRDVQNDDFVTAFNIELPLTYDL